MSRQKTVKARKQALADSFGKATQHHHSGEDRNPVTDTLDIWTGALLKKAATGRGSNGKISAHGIQKLRELILELAVRGKLVPQDSNDEPVNVLLEKISKEEDRLVKEGLIKKPNKFPEIQDDEKSIELPESWAWIRVRRIGHDWGQKKPDKEFSYIDVSAIDNHSGKVIAPSVLSSAEAPSRARKIVKKGTVIYSTVRPYLKNIAVVEGEFDPEPIASTAFSILHPYAEMPGEYLVLFFRSPVFVRYVESVQTGIAYPAINDKQFFGATFPLPPLAEQHRIVTKVDELMALCDQLEQQQTDSIEAHQTLVETLLGALTRAENEKAFTETWQRIADHFDILFTTEHSIDQLKQTILQLAVMGKLVPQDPNDEPASVLLEKIAKRQIRLVKDGELKKQKPLPVISEEEKPYKLPNGWEWSRLPEIGEFARGKSKHRPRNDPALYGGGKTPMVQTGDVSRADPEITTYTALYNENGVAQSRLWPKGTLCITIAANIADTGILAFEACFPDSVVGFNPLDDGINVRYFEYFIRTAKNHLEDFAPSTAQKNINLDILGRLLVPLPASNELNRIVAKIDELMAFCDTLKARLQDAQTTRVQLADAVVEQAVA